MYKNTNHTLIKWIISACFILIIPIICIIANYFYTKALITRKLTEANQAALHSTQYSIDTQLQSTLTISQYIFLDPTFSARALRSANEDEFLDNMSACLTQLQTYQQVNSNMEIMLYLPYKDYIITDDTANKADFIYNTIASKNPLHLNRDTWQQLLSYNYKSRFMISPSFSYANYGKESFVFAATSPFVYDEKVLFNAFISIPCDFIEDLVRDMKQSTLLILDKNGVLQKQFGSHLPISPDTPFSIPEHSTMTALKFQDTSYICTYLKSDVADWYYAICTPNTLFLQEAIHIRNAALFTIFSTLFLGLISIVILQFRNYRPLRKIMGTIPANLKNKQNDEFELLENYYHELHEENRTMRQSISSRADYAKEIFLLSKLKGRDFYLSESDVSEFLGIDYSGKHFAIVSIYADFEAPSFQDSSVNVFDLMSFSISNVLDEVLDSAYPYQKTIDEVFFVYLFILDPPSLALWEEDSGQKFEQIYEFFKSNFHLDLSITISRTFDRFEYLASNYTDILNAFEYRYVIEQYGVLSVDSLQGIDFGALERLEKYKRQFNVSLSQHDYETADRLFHNLFEAFSGSEESLYSCQYYILSITSSMLFTFRNSMNAKIDNRILEQHLFQLTTCNSLAQMQSAFGGVLKLLYGMLDLNSEPEGNVEQLMTKVQLYVEEHYTDGNMNISSIAEAIGLTPKYISKLFKDTTSEGLLSYINHVRIEHAKELLRTTDCTIDEISFRVGFTNSRSFRRNFLKITGQTPTDFRK